MADRDDTPRGHVIERARTGRSTCQSCGKPIVNDTLRLSEAYVSDEGRWARSHQNARTPRNRDPMMSDDRNRSYDDTNPDVWSRFHHLACAAQHQPYKLRSALTTVTLELPERAELERAIERALSATDASEDNSEHRDAYHRFIERLREGPDDELMLVFADWLQSVADPRGELIAVQHALETATGADRVPLADTEKKLLAVHRKHLTPERIDGTLHWHRGFVQRVVLTNVEIASLARVFAHPSLRLVRELVVDNKTHSGRVVAANLPTPLPATLRTLELRNPVSRDPTLGLIGPLLAGSLVQLERLVLEGGADLEDVRHPTLAELELAISDATAEVAATPRGTPRTFSDRVAGLKRKHLPALTRLTIRADRGLDATVAALASTGIVAGLSTLALHGDLTPAGLEPLRSLRKLALAVLDLRHTRVLRTDLPRFAKLAATIVLEDPVAAPAEPATIAIREWLVRHTRRPEWGTGRVVEETDDGLQVEFEHGGAKLVRNVELLEELT
ncbi:MAG: DUF3553 domain-containing protein [Kofleriaceae bacterium]